MNSLVLTAIMLTTGMAAYALPAAAGLGEAAELEHARANARAGGPLNERDAELLERHGCLSGTNSDFCRKREHRQTYRAKRHRERTSD